MSSNNLKGIFFLCSYLNSGVKMPSKPCCKPMFWHPGFAAPCTQHRQSRFSIIFIILIYYLCKNSTCLELKKNKLNLKKECILSYQTTDVPPLWVFFLLQWTLNIVLYSSKIRIIIRQLYNASTHLTP